MRDGEVPDAGEVHGHLQVAVDAGGRGRVGRVREGVRAQAGGVGGGGERGVVGGWGEGVVGEGGGGGRGGAGGCGPGTLPRFRYLHRVLDVGVAGVGARHDGGVGVGVRVREGVGLQGGEVGVVVGVMVLLVLMMMSRHAGKMGRSVRGVATLNLIGGSGQKVDIERVLVCVRPWTTAVAVPMMIGAQIRGRQLRSRVGRVGVWGRDVWRADGRRRRRLR